MGEIYKLSCKCGYEVELNLGGGLSASNINTINRIFSEEKRREFDKHYINGEVTSFFVENEACVCNKCKEIMATPVLNVHLVNNEKFQIANDCNYCSNKVQIINDLLMCPKCGNKLIKQEVGLWD